MLSLVGTVGESAVAPRSLTGWNVARAIAVIRPTGVSARWLQLCFESAPIKSEILGVLNTTVQSTLNLADLKRLRIPVPPAEVRSGIEEVLGALDDKIAANITLFSKIDALAQSNFKSMIIDAALQPLSSTAQFVNGKAFTKGASGTGRVVIRIAELNSGIGGSTVYSDADVPEQYVANPGDLLFAWSGSLTLHRWFRPAAIINQHIFKVIPNEGFPAWLVHELLREKLAYFKSVAADKATTMGHIQRKHLDEPVLVPKPDVIAQHSDMMESLWKLSLSTQVESLQLAETRDTLLPQLMSGRLRVKDAERALEDAGV